VDRDLFHRTTTTRFECAHVAREHHMNANHRDFGKTCKAEYCAGGRLLAAGTGDNTEVVGAGIDTRGFGSGKIVLATRAVLDAAETLKVGVTIQESDDDGVADAYDTAEEIQAATVAELTAVLAGTYTGVSEFDIVLASRKRYVRVNVTPNLSRGATDTAEFMATLVLGGADVIPAA